MLLDAGNTKRGEEEYWKKVCNLEETEEIQENMEKKGYRPFSHMERIRE